MIYDAFFLYVGIVTITQPHAYKKNTSSKYKIKIGINKKNFFSFKHF